jgi:hypothetical protein
MPTFQVKNAAGATVFFDVNGAGTSGDPHTANVNVVSQAAIAIDHTVIPFRNAAVSSAAVRARTGAGRLLGWNIVNTANSVIYAKFFDALNATTGTTPVRMTIAVPPLGSSFFFDGGGIESYGTGISISITSGAADNNTTAPPSAAIVEVRHR